MTDEKLHVGILTLLGVAISFGLTVLFFGFVVLAGALLLIVGTTLLAVGRRRRSALGILGVAGLSLSGPLIYVSLAVLQTA